MSLMRLTLKNACRSPLRGLLTVLAVAITLVAYLLLRSLDANWTERVRQTPNDRVVSRHRIGWAQSLPVRYTEEVRQMPGVLRAMGGRWAGFKWPGNEGLRFGSSAVDARAFVDMHYELSAPAHEKEAFVANRRGALVSRELADETGWKVGDRVIFESREFPGKWEVEVSTIAKSTRHGFGRRMVWLHWEYLNEGLPADARDRIGIISAQIDDPAQGGRIAKAIDVHFGDRDSPTLTLEDKALNAALVGRFGAILDAMSIVSLLVLGIVVLIIGNTLAMVTRERVREYGTLRALGFSPRHVLAFVVGEAATLGLVAGAIGLGLSYLIVEGPASRILEESMRIAPLSVSRSEALAALAASVLLSVLAAGLPALRTAQLRVREALTAAV